MTVNAHYKLRENSAAYKIFMNKPSEFISRATTGNALSSGDH